MLYAVLDHAPTPDDIKAFLERLKTALAARDVALQGITTDGSALSPEPSTEIFGAVPHPRCTFHVIAALVTGILRALASERKRLETSRPRPFNIWLFFVHCCLIENKTPLAGGDTAVVGQRLCPLRSGAAQRCHGPWRVRAPPGRRSA